MSSANLAKTSGNKVAVITGASSGIGAALGREFAARGYSVALLARRKERLVANCEEIEAEGGKAIAVDCDVTKDEDLPRSMKEVMAAFGRIDVVVANAGFGVVGSFERLTLDDYRRQFDTNVWGVIRTLQAALPELKATKGSLAVIGSLNGYVCLPGSSPYGMSKFAVRALCDALYLELKPQGVSVTHIAPGFVDSEIRQVDNKGRWHDSPKVQDKVPRWIRMRTPRAARKMVNAIVRRKREEVITGHAKLGAFFQRHFPWLLIFVISKIGLKGRAQPQH